MEETTRRQRSVQRPARDLTLADCGLLVLGTALALALPWFDGPTDEPFMEGGGPGPVAVWYAPALFAHELLSKCCLALVPVVIWRCHREARSLRPAELLLAVFGAWPLVEAVDAWPAVSESWLMYRVPGNPYSWVMAPAAPFLWSRVGVATLASSSILALLLARRRLPRWVVAALAMVAMLSSYAWLREPIIVGLDQPTTWIKLKSVAGPVAFLVRPAAMVVLWLTPASVIAAAVLDFVGDPRGRRPTEWAGLVLAASTFILCLTDVVYGGIVHPGFVAAEVPGIVAFVVVPPTLSALLGLLLVGATRRPRRITPAMAERPTPRHVPAPGA